MDNAFIFVLIAASIAGTALMFLALRKGAHRQQDLKAFADQQGWQYEHQPATNRTAQISRFSNPDEDWTLSLISSGGGEGSTHRRIEWHTPQGALEDGEAVLGMPLPEKSVAMMHSGGELGKQILKAALKATLHALGKTRFNLTVDEATAGHPGGVVMASDGQAQAMDGIRQSEALAQFRMSHKPAEVPVIIRDATGLTLRLPGRVSDLDDLTALADLGKAVRSSL